MYLKNFYIIISFIFLTTGTSVSFAQEVNKSNTLNINANELLTNDGSTKRDTLKKKTFLEGIIKRNAVGYENIDNIKKQMVLYDEAELYYKDIELKSGIIVLDFEKDEVYAGRLKDSLGQYIQYPIFKQGANVIEPDSIRFNTKSKRIKIWNSRTQQGELNIKAEESKRENDSLYFMKNVRFTTAKNIDDPEYFSSLEK